MLDTGVEPIDGLPAGPRPLHRRPLFVVLVAFGLLLVVGAMLFKILEPIQVLPRIRVAPGFVLTDQNGQRVTSEDLRGSVVLYTFTYAGCEDPCPAPEPTMAEIRDRIGEAGLGDTEIRFVTLSFDPANDTPAVLAERAAAMGADGTDWLYAAPAEDLVKTIIGSGFRTYFEPKGNGSFAFDPTLILVDGWGVVRGEYRYQTLTSDSDKILGHIAILGDEVRNSNGPAGLAYKAAHFFLCYP